MRLNIARITAQLALGLIATFPTAVVAQTQIPPRNASPVGAPAAPAPASPAPRPPAATAPVPSDYVIGVEDVLTIVFWREKELSAEVVVRPDGKISLPMLNDVPAVGLTPEALAATVAKAATKYVKDPAATVIVREIRSRKVYVIGEVSRPGPVALGADMNVLQLLGEVGGFVEGAKKSDVVIVRMVGGTERRFRFNYNEVVKGKNLQQNIKLFPGDTIIVR
jgi:polysaccharide export outer membrane protein